MVMLNQEFDWLYGLKPGLIKFLNTMKDEDYPGFYRYSYSGDLFGPSYSWGLANAVFATKIRYMIGEIDDIEKKNLASFISSFQQENGYIFDNFLKRRVIITRLLGLLRNRQLIGIKKLFSEAQERAETRQSMAALIMLDEKPKYPLLITPKNNNQVEAYLNNLDWRDPWGAGSHFSHLLFFLRFDKDMFNHNYNEDLIEYAIDSVNRLQSNIDGSWGEENLALQLKVNGAMKVITALDAVGKLDKLNYVEKIIDTCLLAVNNEEACSHFNVVYALYKSSLLTTYRKAEINKYITDKLSEYKQYYYPELGGFSFNENKSGTHYLGAKLSKGLNEPDIHGTVMFVWGITLISKALGIDLGLREPVT